MNLSSTHDPRDEIMSDLSDPIACLLPQLSEEDSAVLVTSLPRLDARLKHLRASFDERTLHCIAIKSNPHLGILRAIVERGFGLEAASIEEVRRALKVGCPTEKIVFDSPVKTHLELQEVAQHEGLLVNVNTLSELKRIPSDAVCMIGIRVNPLTDTGSPERFSVGRNESKFGVPIAARADLINAALHAPVRALHMHSGSQMRDLHAQERALNALGELAREINSALSHAGLERRIEVIDIGGGLPSEPLSDTTQMQAYGASVCNTQALSPFNLVTEFGQWVNAECGFALSRVEYVVPGAPSKLFIHLGADMFTRDAYTQARPFPLSTWTADGRALKAEPVLYDIAGPLCFAGDYLARQVSLPQISEGQWLCIDHTGANTYALWSRHCSRDIPAHWVWDGQALSRWSPRRAIDF